MDKRKLGVLAAIGVIALATIGGFAMRANAATPASPQPAAAAVATDTAEADANLPDTDAVQEEVGDQNAADDATEATESESASAEEAGDENLPGGGHQDTGDNVDHEFEGVE